MFPSLLLGRFQSDLVDEEFKRLAQVTWLFRTLSIVTRLETRLDHSQTPTRMAKSILSLDAVHHLTAEGVRFIARLYAPSEA